MYSLFEEKFQVKFKSCSRCDINSHGHYKEIEMNGIRLNFNNPVNWDENNGVVTENTQTAEQCWKRKTNGRLCGHKSKKRLFWVTTPIDKSFIVYFEHGIPATLWEKIMSGRNIYFGYRKDLRQIGGAIFRINGNHYVAAYLITNPNNNTIINPKIWVQMETLEHKIKKFRYAKPENCRFIFIHPPEKSCGCGEYDNEVMVQCPECDHWIHNRCAQIDTSELFWINDAQCNYINCV